jgi:hypothetical protein
MRAVDYVTHGFGIQPQVMPVPTYVMPNPNLVGGGGPIPPGVGDPRYTTKIQGGRWDYLYNPTGPLAYKMYSPSGGSIPSGSIYSNLQERFGLIIQDAVPLGLNPKFIDIARGPNGRTYLTQAIRFLEAIKRVSYNDLLSDVSVNAAYNTAAMRIGTSSPLTPSRTFIKNVISRLGINGIDRMISFYNEVLSAL